jgi:NAD(P)-dependent dehydrogenase (short-subunit alcohol dehydrogenase family)
MIDFEGKVVIVTGASSGLGKAAALRFGSAGAKVVVAARREELGQGVVTEIEDTGGEALFIKTDVTRRQDIVALIDGTVTRFGKLDCAVNNAGVDGATLTPMADIEEADWDQLMDVNLKAVWMCMKYEIPAMIKNGGGSIVNVSSIYGSKPSDVGHAPYAASKYGVIGLSKTAAVDYAQQNIRVNVVSPGFTHSEMVDFYVDAEPELIAAAVSRHSAANRLGDAPEIAEAIIWLCSDAASFVSGSNLDVDGGGATKLY